MWWNFTFKNVVTKNSKEQQFLGVIVHNKQNFKVHVKELCKKAPGKFGTLIKHSNHLNDYETKL